MSAVRAQRGSAGPWGMANQEPSRIARQVGAAPSTKEPGCGEANPHGSQGQASSRALLEHPQRHGALTSNGAPLGLSQLNALPLPSHLLEGGCTSGPDTSNTTQPWQLKVQNTVEWNTHFKGRSHSRARMGDYIKKNFKLFFLPS